MKRKSISFIAMLVTVILVANMFGGGLVNVEAATNQTKEIMKVEITKPTTAVLVLKKGKTYSLKYRVFPDDATNKRVKFTSSNKKVATVSAKGKIKAIKSGYASITVESVTDKEKSAVIAVKVGTPIEKISVNMDSITLEQGETTSLEATISPIKASYKKIRYITSNQSVATVSSNGKITAVAAGTAEVTAMAMDGSGKKSTCSVTVKDTTVPKPPTTSTDTTGNQNNGGPSNPEPGDEYKLVWNDEFNGAELNLNDWNYETREPGWVNNELQEYTDSTDNIYVKDGNLVIKAIKTTRNENGVETDYYTSGKVTTQSKHDFTYGKFEIRAKGVQGQGLWPAIWMMASDENFYGQWPKCGEIDIMEILGNQPEKIYGTIHYGEPHKEQQGTYTLSNGTFADDYHTYMLEWEPDEIRFYIDGNLYHKVNDWFTKVEGKGEVTYPAPFDQPFFLQLNLAVGGNWPGNPDETTDFDNAEFKIDYVRVYQKDYYDTNVTKPDKQEVILRNPDETGNYVVNGDFAINEDLLDNEDWGVKYALSGEGKTRISDNELILETINQGTVDYSVQIVQPNLPIKKGGQYKLTFDAYAETSRNMKINVSAPDHGYIRYFNDTVVSLNTEKNSYEYTFIMNDDSDANGRLEFNLGNSNSTSTVYISNVRLEKIGEVEISEPEKSVLPDGNYVYNGEFQEGLNRMDYWQVEKTDGATVSVTNDKGRRELMVQAPKNVNLYDILVKQEIAVETNKEYVLTFDSYADTAKSIVVNMNGEEFTADLSTQKQQFKYKFATNDTIISNELEFALGVAGVTYIDNVRIEEDGLLINGDFSNGFIGWEPFVDSSISSKVSYVVDSLKENNAAAYGISDTGNQAWQIQLKQNNVHLDEGKWYQLNFNAKTDLVDGRKIMVALQKDGSVDNDWTPYSGEKVVNLGNTYQNFELKFKMSASSDEKTILTFSLGAVDGSQITTSHNVYIDDVTLVEIEPETIPEVKGNIIKNSDFSQGTNFWDIAITPPATATSVVKESLIEFDITNVGDNDWNVQLKQMGFTLQKGHTYQFKMDVTSSVERDIKVAFMTPNYTWYGGEDVSLSEGHKQVNTTFTVSGETDTTIGLFISMGKIETKETPTGKITIQNIQLLDVTESK